MVRIPMRDRIEEILRKATGYGIAFDVTVAPKGNFGHYSTAAPLRLAKKEEGDPMVIAREMASRVLQTAPRNFFEKVEAAAPGFVNFWLSSSLIQKELTAIIRKKEKFGTSSTGKKKKVIAEYSSVNIAKPMHVGHLRNVAVGDALARMHDAVGYKVIRWDYVGDWGTQFGKIIAAYKMWGDKKALAARPMETMLELYVRFHEEAKKDPSLEEKGRAESRSLETGDKESRILWEWFRKESLKEVAKMHKRLGIQFDVQLGESFYEGDLARIISDLKEKGIAKQSEGAWVIFLDEQKLPPALIEKSDGTSLYLTRDIANLEYRLKKYKPAKILYVVGNEQSLNFEQLFAAAKIIGLSGTELVHVKYGLVLDEGGKKFSTREGRTVTAEEIIDKAIDLAAKIVAEKNPDLPEAKRKKVAEAVGLGAVKYTMLRENRNSDIVFDWKKMLDFSGDGAPYLQYTYARFRSILRKAGKPKSTDPKHLVLPTELDLIRKMMNLPDVIRIGTESLAPNLLSNYLYELATLANQYYEATPILRDESTGRKESRLFLVDGISQVLKNGLAALGIGAPEEI
jgi:arginyl-tRNA synthetase